VSRRRSGADTDGYGSIAVEGDDDEPGLLPRSDEEVGLDHRRHIHRGRTGMAGPIVVTLFNGAPPTAPRTCRKTSAALAGEILSNPGRFYVNIHSRSFPDGAIRGQLIK
jgi:CHRD domain